MNIERLRKIAESAAAGPWGESLLVVSSADGRPVSNSMGTRGKYQDEEVNSRHIATFDPPTVLALLEVAERAKELLRVNEEPAGLNPATVYDRKAFSAFLNGCEARVDAAKSALRSALEALDKREAG